MTPAAWAEDAVPITLDPTLTVTLEGEAFDADVHVTEDGEHYLDAGPILAALENDVSFDATENVLMVRRSQDGVVMSLYTDTGLIQANGKDLGHLREYGEVSDGVLRLTPNALSVLSGLIPKFDEDTGVYKLELDPRLKVATGFDILLQDIPLVDVDPEAKAIGPVLLLPLRPIADQLGSDVRVEDGRVTVRRAQDSAVFTLDLSTGVIELRGRPIGVVRDMTYADTERLLLPSNAVEALTGTHVSVSGRNIEIVLDNRLDGAVSAGRSIDEIVKDTPFTPESLTFRLGPQQTNTVIGDFRYQGVNGRVRYEIPDLPDEATELEPSWLSLDFAHVSGLRGNIGDAYADKRQLDGVGVRRIRGVTATKSLENGGLAVAIGVPSQGTVQISDDQARLTYGGFAAGARWVDEDGWEAGLAVRRDNLSDDQFAVLSAISKRHDLSTKVSVTGQANLGAFSGPARERAVDLSFSGAGQARLSDEFQIDSYVQYDGVEFQRTTLEREAVEDAITEALTDTDEIEDEERFPDIRRRDSDRLDYGVSARFTPRPENSVLTNPAVALRLEQQRTGVTIGDERVLSRASASVSTGLQTGLIKDGLSVGLNASVFDLDGPISDSGTVLGANAYMSIGDARVRASYTYSDTELSDSREVATATVTLESKTFDLPKGATLSVSPSVTGTIIDGSAFARGGVVAGLNSGEVFGPKNRVGASLGILQSVSPGGRMRTTEFLSVNYARRLPIGDNMALGLALNSNLDGDVRVGLTLDGRFDFNAKRQLTRTNEGAGVLTGQAFLDANRDGVKQDDERVLPGVILSLEGTPHRLRADANGAFTVQNLPEGLYDVRVLADTLPLGYAQSETAKSRASISDGKLTDLPIAVVQRGQLRGFVFVDENANGTYDKGELRPEGKVLTLKSAGFNKTVRTTSFGQYAFDDLPADEYEIFHEKRPVGRLSLGEFDNLMAKLPVAILPPQFAGKEEDPVEVPPDKEASNIRTPKGDG